MGDEYDFNDDVPNLIARKRLREVGPPIIGAHARIAELEADNARLREEVAAFRNAFKEYAVDEGDCFVCGWPINEFQKQHGEKCIIAAVLEETND